MRVLMQRVKEASVTIENQEISRISKGCLLFVGIQDHDDEATLRKLARKCVELRIFEDEAGKMNQSLIDVQGELLSVSQFTLYADCKKGRRPGFSNAGKPEYAKHMYEVFNEILREYQVPVKCGVFGADMKVSLINDGPVTIWLDSEVL